MTQKLEKIQRLLQIVDHFSAAVIPAGTRFIEFRNIRTLRLDGIFRLFEFRYAPRAVAGTVRHKTDESAFRQMQCLKAVDALALFFCILWRRIGVKISDGGIFAVEIGAVQTQNERAFFAGFHIFGVNEIRVDPFIGFHQIGNGLHPESLMRRFGFDFHSRVDALGGIDAEMLPVFRVMFFEFTAFDHRFFLRGNHLCDSR